MFSIHNIRRDAHVAARLGRAALSVTRPLVAHLIVTRRCNLTCGYCREHDQVSAPVPTDVLRERLRRLAELGTAMVVFTGGEPLLHPDLVDLVAYATQLGLVANMNTNGFLLTEAHIHQLNAAGLYAMQLSIDSVQPNDVTQKALRSVRPTLQRLATHARFRVRVNTVVGSADPEEAVQVTREVTALGLEAKASLMRGDDGQVVQLGRRTKLAYAEIRAMRPNDGGLSPAFQDKLLAGEDAKLKCRAGARFFHVCEDGLVHFCEHKYGSPGKPLLLYTEADLRAAFYGPKPCARTCPIVYAHQASSLDAWRSQRGEAR